MSIPPRLVAVVSAACLALLAGTMPSAQASERASERALPETVTIHDGRSSRPVVDIAKVKLQASWYWDSEQAVRVKVPHGFRPGHRLTVYFDIDGDPRPEGHYTLKLRKPPHPGGKNLKKVQEFRLGGGWGKGGKKVRCGGSEGGPPVFDRIKIGKTRSVGMFLDLWWCLKTPNPPGLESGAWRVSVQLAKGRNIDMAPNHRRWSKRVAGWGPCDPSGGQCP